MTPEIWFTLLAKSDEVTRAIKQMTSEKLDCPDVKNTDTDSKQTGPSSPDEQQYRKEEIQPTDD